MFIYRDEVYNPNTERRGIADIIVAKHRNGPTDTFCLEFEPHTTRFRDPTDEVVSPLTVEHEDEWEVDIQAESDDECELVQTCERGLLLVPSGGKIHRWLRFEGKL